jgi:hypothetical protein
MKSSVLISNIRRFYFVLSRVDHYKTLVLREASWVNDVHRTAVFNVIIESARYLMIVITTFVSKNDKVWLWHEVKGVNSVLPSYWLDNLR